MNDIRKNGSGCNDPTAYAVITKITCECKVKTRSRRQDKSITRRKNVNRRTKRKD